MTGVHTHRPRPAHALSLPSWREQPRLGTVFHSAMDMNRTIRYSTEVLEKLETVVPGAGA